ncbi:MAG: hypothetical protein QOE70_1116 [Chthoniobacter sp.]|jgi:uncharacterized membrane-anchored protein|nr:hypothetical protein [Chthoniobacter sp.]
MYCRSARLAALCFAILPLFHATAAPETPEAMAGRFAEMKKLADSLHYQQGQIELRNGLAKINVPASFRYLNPADTETVLSKIWGNPPTGERSLGMLFPAETGPIDPDSWGVIITYEEDGFVKDNDASTINYDDLLKQMKQGTAEASKVREKKGFSSIELVGWAARPRYDAAEHKMYWAKELRFGGEPGTTLNYNIRMLGRRGVLVLNAVANTEQLATIEKTTPDILAMVNFQEGHRYADFNPSTDKVATYGLAALVAGGLLAKGGFFKLLIAGLIAAKKFVIVGAVALFAGIKKLISKFSPPSQRNVG